MATAGFLSVTDLQIVYKELYDVRAKWYNFGLQLKARSTDLDAIKQKNRDPEDCLRDLLNDWLKQANPKPTWKLMISALQSPTVGFEQLAESMANKFLDTQSNTACGGLAVNGPHSTVDDSSLIDDECFHCPCGQCDLLSYLENGCPESNSKQYPYLDLSELDELDRQDIVQKLSQDTSRIIQSFADLDSNTSQSLKKQDVSVDTLLNIALSIGVYVHKSDEKDVPVQDENKLQEVKTIDTAFISLREHWSFFDYEILSHIIWHLGSECDKENLRKYDEKFKHFCERKVTEVSPSIFDQDGQKRKRRKYFVVLVTKDIIQNLKDVKAAERKVASLLGLNVSTLRLHRIDIGSIILVFSLPTFLQIPKSFVCEVNGFTLCVPKHREKYCHPSTKVITPEAPYHVTWDRYRQRAPMSNELAELLREVEQLRKETDALICNCNQPNCPFNNPDKSMGSQSSLNSLEFSQSLEEDDRLSLKRQFSPPTISVLRGGSGSPRLEQLCSARSTGNLTCVIPGMHSQATSLDSGLGSTSQSSTSEALFIPTTKHTQSVFTESDEPHHSPHHQRGTRRLIQPTHYKQHRHQHQHQQHPQSTPSPISQSLHHQQQQQLSQSSGGGGGSRTTSGGDTLIFYHLDDFPMPFVKRLRGGEITLSDFKEKGFPRKGKYRFFFKNYNDDLQAEIMEEYSDEGAVLPLIRGKIIGRVEKISETQQDFESN